MMESIFDDDGVDVPSNGLTRETEKNAGYFLFNIIEIGPNYIIAQKLLLSLFWFMKKLFICPMMMMMMSVCSIK